MSLFRRNAPLPDEARKAELAQRSRLAHTPGSCHQVADATYQAQANGAWKRLSPRRHEDRTGDMTKAQRRRARKGVR